MRLKERTAGEPTAMLNKPKLRVAGVIWRWDCASPVPVRAPVRGEAEADVERESVPVRVPVWVGVKVTWRVQLEAGARMNPAAGQKPREAV